MLAKKQHLFTGLFIHTFADVDVGWLEKGLAPLILWGLHHQSKSMKTMCNVPSA